MTAADKVYVVRPEGLHPQYIYQVNHTDIIADGMTIMNVGIPLINTLGEHETRTFYMERINAKIGLV